MKKLTLAVLLCAVLAFVAAPAMAALTVSITKSFKLDKQSARLATITFDNSYATGGESLTAANLKLSGINYITCQPTDQYTFEYDYAGADLEVFNTSADAVASGDLATVSTRCFAIGY